MQSQINLKATALTRARYQRLSTVYDLMEGLSEKRYFPWHKQLWELVKGTEILEVGVGTGKNMPFYPSGVKMTAIDLTPGMLERAHMRAAALRLHIALKIGDVQALEFPDSTFDAVVATCVFCSVPNPVLGFTELGRVLKPNGKIYLLEHMRIQTEPFGKLMDAINPLIVRMMGANINRRTLDNIHKAGLKIETVQDLAMGGMFKMIVAQKG
jgi:ubiquinone/menaquinone biosynthesis C-methylase UbiE